MEFYKQIEKEAETILSEFCASGLMIKPTRELKLT